MDHHIRRLDQAQRAEREQVCPAGAGTDEGCGDGLGREQGGHGGTGPGLFDFPANIGNIPDMMLDSAMNKDVCSATGLVVAQSSGFGGQVE
ncbi:MAG: hypothetical protein U5K36_16695 [Roseovarius sp.]|nr:hypothetical protein [Roseovarius sp.]